MANAQVALATTTLGANAATITFSSIPATGYRDLRLVLSVRATNAATTATLGLYLNGDTSNIYAGGSMRGNGSATSVTGGMTGEYWLGEGSAANDTANTFTEVVVDFIDAFATDKYKSWITRNSTPNYWTYAAQSRWASTAAISSIQIYFSGGSIATGSTLSLYGIVA